MTIGWNDKATGTNFFEFLGQLNVYFRTKKKLRITQSYFYAIIYPANSTELQRNEDAIAAYLVLKEKCAVIF